MSDDLFLSSEGNYTFSDVTIYTKGHFTLPTFTFSNKTVTGARNNPASFPPIIVWVG